MNEHQLVSLRSLKLVNGDGIFVLAKCRVAEDVNSAKVDLLIYSQNSVLESKGMFCPSFGISGYGGDLNASNSRPPTAGHCLKSKG